MNNGQRVMGGLAAHSNKSRTRMEQIAHPCTLAYDMNGEAHVCHFDNPAAGRAHLIECATGAWALIHGNGIVESGSVPPVQRRAG